jgi:hypothetical protein
MSVISQSRINQMNGFEINQIPEDVHIEIGKYLNNRSLYNLLSSSKYNFNTQKIEIKNRYFSLLEKYNREEMIKKYCPMTCTTWYVDLFLKIKNKKEWGNSIVSETVKEWGDSIISEAVSDLNNIIKLIQAGYDGYQKDKKSIIFMLMPWSKENPTLLYFLKKMLKCNILDGNITNMSGAYPIGHAVAYKNYEAVKILVEYGNGFEPITNDKLDLLISISKNNGHMYRYLTRHKILRLNKMK